MMRWPTFLLLACCASPSLACEPARYADPIGDRRLERIATSELAKSTAVVDAVVGPWTRQGVVLDIRRIWRGRAPRRVVVMDNGCGSSFPRSGAWVRVLLTRDPVGGEWMSRDPALGGMLTDHRRLDRIIDRRLGSPRPARFATVASSLPPPPPPPPR